MPQAETPFPDHSGRVPAETIAIIARLAWRSARSTEDVAPHEYVVGPDQRRRHGDGVLAGRPSRQADRS